MHNTGFKVGADGAKQLGETLKTNTTLTKLNLEGEKRDEKKRKDG